MGGWRKWDWSGGARARLYFRVNSADPLDDNLLGYVWHPHIEGEGWLDDSHETSNAPAFTIPTDSTITFTRKGHHCPVRIRFERNGTPEEHIMPAGDTTLTLTTDGAEVLETFTIRGL